MSEMTWNERVPMLSINPDAANRDDIARMAAELMEVRCALNHIMSIYGDKFTPTTLDCARRAMGRGKVTMKYKQGLSYESTVGLFDEHGANTPSEYAREAYDRTGCGVWTAFILADGESVQEDKLNKYQDTPEWAARHIVGVLHGSIVEGFAAEFKADELLFPFSDEELAAAWQYLEDLVTETREGIC